ncbi:GNAT family N-acetyltransferase [Arsenicicoccus piscis]|uniref:GNAT family N-acetyltransferase n=1 Tax=Arsenicicoccus piscis TaxID=673954 RepID=UPI001F4C6141|nr:GNAT family N-acetyltransferase [Arsenicicoccus piscis]MCH8628328.1 GNAT family N-acetyltransferase [Arsenicicoccus piscis]
MHVPVDGRRVELRRLDRAAPPPQPPWLEQFGGHIGYGVRPSERGRGLAAWALHRTLATALDLGLDRVLLTANDANPASWRTIERCGGVMQDVIRDGKGYLRRYRITL